MLVFPDPDTNYNLIVQTLDTARSLDPTDPPMTRKEGGKTVRLRYLFPDVIIAGSAES
jgi:hypothetical protein